MEGKNKLETVLMKAGHKMTIPRQEIMNVLLINKGKHLTAEDIYHQLREQGAQVGMATVYRTLELFCDLGILSALHFQDSVRHYELEIEEEDHHHHLICQSCGKIEEFSDELLQNFMGNVEERYGFTVTHHSIKYFGYCRDCSRG